MLRIGERAKFSSYTLIPLILIGVLFVVFAHFRITIFYGERSDALNILNGVVQVLSTIIAIVFSIIIVVVQSTLGKYVTKATWYVVSDRVNILMLCLYLSTIGCALGTMWIINSETWNLWVDVTLTASLICLCALIPFFLRMSQSVSPTLITEKMKNEVLDACQEKNYERMTSKTNLLVNTIKKSLEDGEDEYAFEGTKYIEEIIEKEDYPEQRWMFSNYVLSLLDDLGTRSLGRNPNYTLRILEVYGKMLPKLQEIPPAFHNVANSMVQSIMNICKDGLDTKLGKSFVGKSYYLILEVYKTDILLDYFVFSVINLDPSLRQVLKYCVYEGIFETVGVNDFVTTDAILELLKKEKQSEALHLFQVIFEETPETPFALQGIIRLIKDSKVEGFDSFASSVLNMTKQRFKSFTLDIVYDPKLEGRSSLSVSPDYKIVHETGIEKEKEASLWIKHACKQIGRRKEKLKRVSKRKKHRTQKKKIQDR
jgi:hypothetical protein